MPPSGLRLWTGLHQSDTVPAAPWVTEEGGGAAAGSLTMFIRVRLFGTRNPPCKWGEALLFVLKLHFNIKEVQAN